MSREIVRQWLLPPKARTDPKKNTLYLYGQPSTGKSAFAHALTRIFDFRCIVGSGAKNDFAFCALIDGDPDIYMAEELLLWPECVDQTKLLLEGSSHCTTNVKHKNFQSVVPPRPVFVSSNHLFWNNLPAHGPAFVARCHMINVVTPMDEMLSAFLYDNDSCDEDFLIELLTGIEQ